MPCFVRSDGRRIYPIDTQRLRPFIFDNPFAKAMRLMGAHDFSKLVYKGKRLYDKYKEELTKDCSDEEFMALFEAYPQFDDLDDEFVEMEEEVTVALACYG